MAVNHSLLAAFSCALLLASCGNSPEPVVPPPTAPVVPPPTASAVPPPAEVPAIPPDTASPAPSQVGEGRRGVDSPTTQPMAPLSKEKEVNSMPLAGQGNSHSSPSLDPTSGK
jgi:hypothetical protein